MKNKPIITIYKEGCNENCGCGDCGYVLEIYEEC